MLLALLVLLLFLSPPFSSVDIHSHGSIEYCNKNPSKYTIDSLPSSDHSKIKSFTQLHVFIRHGARLTLHPISTYFPNSSNALQFNCTVKTVTHRHTSNISNIAALRKNYVTSEQVVEGNCQSAQTLPDLITQHTINGNHLQSHYIGSNSYSIFNKSIFTNLTFNIKNNKYNLISGNSLVWLYSTDVERCLASLSIIVSAFLNVWDETIELDMFTHDTTSDPWRAYDDENCPRFGDWKTMLGMQSEMYKELWDSEWAVNIRNKWMQQTGTYNSVYLFINMSIRDLHAFKNARNRVMNG